MGTKRHLSRVVSELAKTLPCGALLDAFSGMCAVGGAIAPSRQVWTNDIQPFPALVGQFLFCSTSESVGTSRLKQVLEPYFTRNLKALHRRFKGYLEAEQKYLSTHQLSDVLDGNTGLPYVGSNDSLERERKRLARKPSTFPYRLATIAYAGTFFGASQCMEADSVRYAIDSAIKNGEMDPDQKGWVIIALAQVLAHINNSTGQFAQFIKPRQGNIERIIEKRRRSVWAELFVELESLSPLGDKNWRSKNRAFQMDTLSLLERLSKQKERPVVVYADPPYSEAQYSRYYHVLDVIAEYRYPAVTGHGRYPTGRYQAPFAQSRAVANSIARLVENASKIEACLLLSYPENGLFITKGGDIIRLLQKHYRYVDIAFSDLQKHSTFGGPAAAPTVSAVENIYIARKGISSRV